MIEKFRAIKHFFRRNSGKTKGPESLISNEELPIANGSFFPWNEVHRHEDILGGGAQWTDALGPGLNRDVTLEGTRDPAVQKKITHALVRAALNSNKPNKLGEKRVTFLPDGRVVAYERYVLKGGDFVNGLYVIDLNDQGDKDHYSQREIAERFLEDMESVGDYEPNAKMRVNLMIDAMVNFFPDDAKKEDQDAA